MKTTLNMKSWNHAITAVKAGGAFNGCCGVRIGLAPPREPGRRRQIRCDIEAAWIAELDYVTGAPGRVTRRHQALCEAHAERWAQAHGVAWPVGGAR